jgi:acyl transferase domain-containing protein
VADGDPIYGCVTGVAVRNDGAKRDFTSPSIEGHAKTIAQALDNANTLPTQASPRALRCIHAWSPPAIHTLHDVC